MDKGEEKRLRLDNAHSEFKITGVNLSTERSCYSCLSESDIFSDTKEKLRKFIIT